MFSKVIRRTHMYLALFLAPWMLMYALSTMAMNHRPLFRSAPVFEKEREQSYNGSFSADARPQAVAAQILNDLGLEGAYSVANPSRDGRLTIFRQDPITPRRIIYNPAEGKLTVEKVAFRTPAFLERLHRRRGYAQPYALDDTWAVSVDLVIAAMIFWVLSGLWMWWEMRVTRFWGGVFGVLGLALFGLFLLKI